MRTVIIATARATDALVILGAALGAVLALVGLASFDPRVRHRLPVAVLARGNAAVAIGLLLAGLLVIGFVLG